MSLADGQGLREGDRGAQKASEDTAWMSASEASGDRCAGQSPRVLQQWCAGQTEGEPDVSEW